MERKLSSAKIIALGFIGIILLGGFLLTLPVMHTNGRWMNFVDALFTATSAVCVTGLVVVDTGTHFTTLGQLVIIALIQMGGLGIITVAYLLLVGLGMRLHFSQRNLLTENFSMENTGGVVKVLLNVVKYTVIIETIGALVLASAWIPQFGLGKGLYYGFWHSVSAFCNAGFDLMGGYKSLTEYVGSLPVNLAITGLIILGGLGFPVLMDVWGVIRHKKSGLQYHSRIVLLTTALLIVGGAIIFMLLEYHGILRDLTGKEKVLASYFQSVTPRTAGYATIDYSKIKTETILFTCFLMFVGASPISTGGGIKTSTFAILLMTTIAVIRGDSEVRFMNKGIDKDLIMKSLALTVLGLALVSIISLVISMIEPYSYERILFEVVSGFGTVGLSTGITPYLTVPTKLLLTLIMYIGRIGPLTFGLAFAEKRRRSAIKLPEGKLYIG